MQPHHHRVPALAVFALLAGFSLAAAVPVAAVGRRLDLPKMTELAGTIVTGRITKLRAGAHPRYRNIGVLHVTLKVSETLKGDRTPTLTFMQFTGRSLGNRNGKGLTEAHPLPEMPSYRVGEEVVLFLYPPSEVGFTSPVGGAQGKFRVRREPGQPVTVISQGGNRSLLVEGDLPGGLSREQQQLLRRPGETIELGQFRSTVKKLVQGEK
jgi:hypothetical protein